MTVLVEFVVVLTVLSHWMIVLLYLNWLSYILEEETFSFTSLYWSGTVQTLEVVNFSNDLKYFLSYHQIMLWLRHMAVFAT